MQYYSAVVLQYYDTAVGMSRTVGGATVGAERSAREGKKREHVRKRRNGDASPGWRS